MHKNDILLAALLAVGCYVCEPEPTAGPPGSAVDYSALPPNTCQPIYYCLNITGEPWEHDVAHDSLADWEYATEHTIYQSSAQYCREIVVKFLDEQDPEMLAIIRATLMHPRGYTDGNVIYINRDRACGATGTTVRHELGHQFGLHHNVQEGTIMFDHYTELATTNVTTEDVINYLNICK